MRKYFAHLSNIDQTLTEENLLQNKKKSPLKSFQYPHKFQQLDICFHKHQRVDSDLGLGHG